MKIGYYDLQDIRTYPNGNVVSYNLKALGPYWVKSSGIYSFSSDSSGVVIENSFDFNGNYSSVRKKIYQDIDDQFNITSFTLKESEMDVYRTELNGEFESHITFTYAE